MEMGLKNVNNEVEAFVGELAQLRKRELKLARVVNACEELLDRNLEYSDEITTGDILRLETLKRLVRDPEVANWMDLMRASDKAPLRQLHEGAHPQSNIDQELLGK